MLVGVVEQQVSVVDELNGLNEAMGSVKQSHMTPSVSSANNHFFGEKRFTSRIEFR